MHDVISLVNAEHMYHLRRVPAANHAHFQPRTSSVHADFSLLLLTILVIKYSMYDAILLG